MAELETRIRERAYAIWEQSGCPEGRERQHWEQAAREVLASGRAEPARKTASAKSAVPSKTASAKGKSRRAAA